MNVCKCYIVSGVVQGVGFRYHTQRQAARVGVSGWARNLANGQVEVVASGSQAQLDKLHEWLRQGPPAARVINIEVSRLDPAPQIDGFSIL